MSGVTDAGNRTFPKSVQPGIPKLKLPKPGWNTVRFGDVLRPVARRVKMDDKTEYRLVTVKRSRGGLEERARLTGRQISVKSQFMLQGGDFLISKRQIVHGACAMVPDDFSGAIVSNEYSVLRCTPEIDLNFLWYLAHSIYFQQTCFHSSIGVHVEKMIFKLEDWFEWSINLPSLPEQQKIADFLGTVDAKLEALRRRQAGLEAFKSGLMQRLFSQDLRFTRDDGTAFPEWEEMPFGAIAIRRPEKFDPRKSCASPQVIELEHIEGGSGRILDAGEIGDQISLKNHFQAGDILFGKLRPYLKKFARPNFEGVCSSEIWVLNAQAPISNDFLYVLVRSSRFMEAANISSGSKMPRADWAIVSSVEFPVPHPDEQRKIADALSTLDAKIAAVAAQITHMQGFKQGLLQQLFV